MGQLAVRRLCGKKLPGYGGGRGCLGPDGPSALLSRFVSTAGNNFINFNNADYDAAYAKALGTIDDDEKTAAFKECETLLAEHAANVYIQDLPYLVALNKKYAGYEFYPLYVQDVSKLYIVEE